MLAGLSSLTPEEQFPYYTPPGCRASPSGHLLGSSSQRTKWGGDKIGFIAKV